MNTTRTAFLISIIALLATASGGPQKQTATPRPPAYSYLRFTEQPIHTIDAKRYIEEIKHAIEADPKNPDHYFNLTSAYALVLSPPDLPAARAAYKTALELGAMHDKQFDELLKTK